MWYFHILCRWYRSSRRERNNSALGIILSPAPESAKKCTDSVAQVRCVPVSWVLLPSVSTRHHFLLEHTMCHNPANSNTTRLSVSPSLCSFESFHHPTSDKRGLEPWQIFPLLTEMLGSDLLNGNNYVRIRFYSEWTWVSVAQCWVNVIQRGPNTGQSKQWWRTDNTAASH